ncbi:hypothetical protein KBZ10_11560 [Streptomyces sp. F63]|uniref:hypothetical protein n=1 Tax=Streptomyces sp. F63 TaxID=2824887 RepID=UPI001B37ED9C|nr:hypothetical protein [Streptomyces sp. F63]MBQ0985146.1 hypothetical protein [Streptomyces sp. F63]
MTDTTRAPLTGGQITVLAVAGVLMLGTGAAGAWGTFTNITAEFGRAATAAGMVAAGEGATLVLALVMVGVTLLGQSAPVPVRAGLWLAPLVASAVGLAVADDLTEAVIYGVSPMGMCVAAEGLGFLARRVVVYRTGVDAEAQRRNAEAVQRLAYHRARAAGHPDEKMRRRSELAAWKLARRVGTGDAELGERLVAVQRERLTAGADAALADMFGAARELSAPVDVEDQADGAVTVERADDGPVPPVMPPVAELPPVPLMWDRLEHPDVTAKLPAAVPAEAARQVVTEPVTEMTGGMTAAELRRAARRLNRQAVKDTGRPVTIDSLRDGLGLSRRQATELRREVVRSRRPAPEENEGGRS